MARFAKVDEFNGATGANGIVDAGDDVAADDFRPVVVFLEGAVEGGVILENWDVAAFFGARILKHEAWSVKAEFVVFDVAGRGDHVGVGVVEVFFARIEVDRLLRAGQ